MKIIAVYNIKGGVGKTATAANLSYLAAKENAMTLLCDLDPQGSASYYFRIKPSKKFNQKTLLKGGKKFEKNIKGTDFDYLDLLPADLSYRNLDITLDDMKRSRKRLKEVLHTLEDEYDYIFLDCPPNITLLSENVFQAADHLLVPVIPTTLSVLTYEKLLEFFKDQKLNRKKIIPFFSMAEKRKKMHREIVATLSGKKKGAFLEHSIPYSVKIEKMGIYRSPVSCFSPKSASAKAYQALWKEIKKKI